MRDDYVGFSSDQRRIDTNASALTVAERFVVGALLADNGRYGLISSLRKDDFSDAVCGRIYESIQDIIEGRIEGVVRADPVTCAGHPSIEGIMTASRLRGLSAQAQNIDEEALLSHTAMIKKKSARRRLKSNLAEVHQLVSNDGSTYEQIQRAIRGLDDVSDDGVDSTVQGVGAYATQAMNSLRERMTSGVASPGITTGISELDVMTGGLRGGQLVVIAGRPAMGKTSLALGIGCAAAEKGHHGHVVTLEMSGEDLAVRLISMKSGIKSSKIRRGALDADEIELMAATDAYIQNLPIDINDTFSMSIERLYADVRKAARKGRLGLLIIDYLQLMETSENSQRETKASQVALISRSLKKISREFNIPVIALSQLNRDLERRADKRPVMSDLRESGAIEQDADLILFVYRDEVYNPNTPDPGVAEIIIGKQRDGKIGTVRTQFDGDTTTFRDHPDFVSIEPDTERSLDDTFSFS